jgi:hypothetical protein
MVVIIFGSQMGLLVEADPGIGFGNHLGFPGLLMLMRSQVDETLFMHGHQCP